ncbi:MAG TPA: transcription antitermination factor NusB [Vicinamibacterales bacterium]|nr:transcription antitermination factor NusB [Vicinamibacterales bacterium]
MTRAWKHEERHAAREAALQILYQWEVGGAPLDDTLAAYWQVREQDPASEDVPAAVDRDYAAWLARGTAEGISELDPLIEHQAEHWRLSRMAVVDRLILRLAAYELRHAPETPAPVVINEALELARTFSGEDAVRFINGILDALARTSGRS